MQLYHHGVKGQEWGVRNGPPYPLTRVVKGDIKSSNDIYNTLDKHQKYLLAGGARTFIKEKEAKYLVEQALVKMGDVPISACDIWNQGDGAVSVSIETRAGYQGKGYAAKAVKAGLEAVKKYENVEVIYWGAFSKNKGSRKLAENNGFKLIEDDGEWSRYEKKNK